MNPDQAAELLGHAAAYDNRNPSAAAAVAWASALHDVPLDGDAKAAVAMYYTTPPQNPHERLWILPHHIRTLRSKLRSARLVNFQYEPIGDETTAEYIARLRGQTQAIASGLIAPHTGRPALEGGPHRSVVKELTNVGRTVPDSDDEALADTVRRAGPLGIQCPTCNAAIGFPCKTPGGSRKHVIGRPRLKPHSARTRAAAGQPDLTTEQRAAEEQRIRDMAARHLARTDGIPDAEIVDEAS